MTNGTDRNAPGLDLTSLRDALSAYERGLRVYRASIADDAPDDVQEVVRAGVVQTFEFTYELCWKLMKRWLEANISPNVAFGVTRREFYRICAENGLIDDVDRWMEFHSARNMTSHIYHVDVAEEVAKSADEFARYAEALLYALERRR